MRGGRPAPCGEEAHARRTHVGLCLTLIMSGVFSTKHLHDKVVLITGASSGIGAAAAMLFARAGANVVLAARRADRLTQVQAECEQANQHGATGHGGRYATLSLDMRSKESIDSVLHRLPSWAEHVDVLGTYMVTHCSEQCGSCLRH